MICGAMIGTYHNTTQAKVQDGSRSTTLSVIAALGIFWGVFAIAYGMVAIVNTEFFMDGVDLGQWEAVGLDIQLLYDMIKAIGVVLLFSGILSMITAVLVLLRKYHTVALISCIIGSVLALISLVGIIGLILAYFLHKSKKDFID